MVVTDAYSPGRPLTLGMVPGGLPPIPTPAPQHQSRNNRLLLEAVGEIRPALDAVAARMPPHRIGIVVGTSTSGMAEGEQALRALLTAGAFPAPSITGSRSWGAPPVPGPMRSASTAGLHDLHCLLVRRQGAGQRAAVAAGRDLRRGAGRGRRHPLSLHRGRVHLLEAVSPQRCNPFSANRAGVNIGEGAALFLVSGSRGPSPCWGGGNVRRLPHLAPDPTGRGVRIALEEALREADLSARDVDYLNLHGHGHAAERCHGSQGRPRAVRRRAAVQLDKAPHRPRPGRRRGGRGGPVLARPERGESGPAPAAPPLGRGRGFRGSRRSAWWRSGNTPRASAGW